LNPIFHEILSAFRAAGVEFMVVGGYAVAAHGVPRATGDIDLWVRPTPANAAKVMLALRAFGAPLAGIAADDFVALDLVYQFGRPPNRVDVLTAIDGLEFDAAQTRQVLLTVEGLEVAVPALADLIANKLASGRPQDVADVHRLRRLGRV
jgi:hypothetical protein